MAPSKTFSSGARDVRAVILAAALLASAPAHADAGPARVGFANLAPARSGAAAAIDRARAALPAHRLVALPPGAVRDALEAPLAPAGDGDTARAPLARAREHLAAARRAYASFAYPRALTELDAVDHALMDREPSPPVTDALVERFLLAGLVAAGSGHPARARAAFRLVHHLDPNRTRLDPGEYRPQVVSLYQDATRQADQRGTLRLVTAPRGARVWLDGHLLGPAPRLERDVDPGPHWLVATAVGRAPRGRVVDVDAGKTRTVELALAAHPATRRIAELRQAAAAATSTDELSASAAQLAGAAEVDRLVLVRARGGAAEAAAYDATSGVLSGWTPLPSPALWAELAPPAANPGLVAGNPALIAGARANRGVDLTAGPRRPSWYRTWWGKGLLIAGGVAVGGVIIYAATRDASSSYTLGGWCFAGEACPP